MNAYDFDKTVFYPDSSVCFYKYCLKKYPSAVFRTVPRSITKAVLYCLGKINAKELKEQLFSYLVFLPDADKTAENFWKENEGKVCEWYLKQKRKDDVIISASPEFLLKPLCDKYEIDLIGTRMDRKNGKIDGKNCHGFEKVVRFRAKYPDAEVECFFSDSLSDTPMAQIAAKAVLVRKKERISWPKNSIDM